MTSAVPQDPGAGDTPSAGAVPPPGAQRADEDAVLDALLADAERTVQRLRAELAAREQVRRNKELTAAQHAEIDRLADHLAKAQVHWGHVRSFFEAALAELTDATADQDDGHGRP